jgi:RNA polymerase sigma-70 factor (ECF subfamily)
MGGRSAADGKGRAVAARAADLARKRQVVEAFGPAARGGDFEAPLAVLDPEVVMRSDRAGAPREIRGTAEIARRAGAGGALAAAGGALAAAGGALATPLARINGAVGVVALRGRLMMVLEFTIVERKIVAIDAITDPERLQELDLAILAE